jgi:hypothetical protein
LKYDELDDLLTIEQAGKLIHVGRCSAYEMASMYEANPETGMPVVNIGRKKFVPKWELLKRFRIIPDQELIRLLAKEIGQDVLLKIIKYEGGEKQNG